jgi:hypothetical protein
LWGTQYVHVRKGRGERRGKVREKGGKWWGVCNNTWKWIRVNVLSLPSISTSTSLSEPSTTTSRLKSWNTGLSCACFLMRLSFPSPHCYHPPSPYCHLADHCVHISYSGLQILLAVPFFRSMDTFWKHIWFNVVHFFIYYEVLSDDKSLYAKAVRH